MSRTRSAWKGSMLARASLLGWLSLASLGASANLVTSRATLGGNDFIDWGQLGSSFTTTASNSAPAATNLGLTATASQPGDPFLLFNSVDHGGNLGGNILSTNFTAGPITIDFDVGLAKIGAQIQANDFGAFTGLIQVYDSLDNLLETQSFGGTSNYNQDNSAIFIGISRASADIDHVKFSITGTDAGNLDFAINQVDLKRTPDNVNPTPEPASLALVGVALAGIARVRRKANAQA